MDDTKIAEALERFTDCNHVIDDPSQGYDCYNSLLFFYRDLGVNIPTEHQGWNVTNYKEKWKKNEEEGRQVIASYLKGLGEKIEFQHIKRGDLLIFEGQTKTPFAGIFSGNGNVFLMFAEGGRVCPLKFFKSFLVDCRRLF